MRLQLLSLLSIAGLSLAAHLTHDECTQRADQAQDDLRSLYPHLEDAANSDEAQEPENRDFANSLSNAMTQVSAATGPRSDTYRSEMLQRCGEGNEDVEENTPFASAVYSSLGQVYNGAPGRSGRTHRNVRRQSHSHHDEDDDDDDDDYYDDEDEEEHHHEHNSDDDYDEDDDDDDDDSNGDGLLGGVSSIVGDVLDDTTGLVDDLNLGNLGDELDGILTGDEDDDDN
ncbi:hypothetical protein BDW68DRAFT_180878 [Aspergillus falconensis]